MRTFHSRLVQIDGSTKQETKGMTIDQCVEGYRKLLENTRTGDLYIFRRHPISASDGLVTHIHMTRENS